MDFDPPSPGRFFPYDSLVSIFGRLLWKRLWDFMVPDMLMYYPLNGQTIHQSVDRFSFLE